MNKRQAVATRLLGPVALLVMVLSPITGAAEERNSLSMSLFTTSANAATRVLRDWAAEVEAETDGGLSFRLYTSGQMGPPFRQYELAQTNVANASWFSHGFTPGQFPVTETAYLPGLFSDSESGSVAVTALSENFLRSEHQRVKIVALAYSAPLKIFTSDKPVRHPEDLRGLSLTIPGPLFETLRLFGVKRAPVPPRKMGEALERGIIDGVITTYEATAALGLANDVTYATEVDVGSIIFALVMNREVYEALPADEKRVLDRLSGSVLSRRLGEAFDVAERKAREKALQLGVQTVNLTASKKTAFRKAFARSVDKQLKGGSRRRAFYNALRDRVTNDQ